MDEANAREDGDVSYFEVSISIVGWCLYEICANTRAGGLIHCGDASKHSTNIDVLE
jgi:hypothetical protein